MTDMSKKTMKQALEALKMCRGVIRNSIENLVPVESPNPWFSQDVDQAITALREALAEQPAQQELVAWMHWLHGPVRLFFNKDEAQMELERLNREYPVDVGSRKMRPLVFGDTSPPTLSLAQRKPLTVDEMWKNDELMSLNAELGCSMDLLMEVVEAIEAAHGITKE